MKTALIFGVTGQDGFYLSKLLLEKGYRVIGVKRRSSVDNTTRLHSLLSNYKTFEVVEGDVTDFTSVFNLLTSYHPFEIYNLAAQSHVHTSFEQPAYTSNVNYNGVLNILEVMRKVLPLSRFYQANTSEMFGNNYSIEMSYDQYTVIEHFNIEKTKFIDLWSSIFCGQDDKEFLHSKVHQMIKDGHEFATPFQYESTPFSPMSPYAVSKAAAHYLVGNYRKAYNLHASAGILFNHECPLRGDNFVTQKIAKYIGRLNKHGDMFGNYNDFPKLKLGNLQAKRDWGHAEDYVRAMWLMLQQTEPDDYVVATGETHTVEEFCQIAFDKINLNYKDFVEVDKSLFRPSEVPYLLGRADKAKEKLGWSPTITFKELVEEMVDAQL